MQKTVIANLNIENQYINNTKLADVLVRKDIDPRGDSFEMAIRQNIVNLIDLKCDKNVTLSDDRVTAYDMAIMEAIYTLVCNGIECFPLEWILKVMTGDAEQVLTKTKAERMERTIEKLQSIWIQIDCSAEYNAFHAKKGEKPVKSYSYKSHLLSLGKAEAVYGVNGQRAVAYKTLEKPVLLQYAEFNRQIISIPASWMGQLEGRNSTDDAILINRYVIKRVAQIVSSNGHQSNKISYAWFDRTNKEERGMLPELGYDTDSDNFRRKVKPKIKKIVTATLDRLKALGVITGYREYREGGTCNPASPVAGFEIFNAKQANRR